jgi:hypothetical protein
MGSNWQQTQSYYQGYNQGQLLAPESLRLTP